MLPIPPIPLQQQPAPQLNYGATADGYNGFFGKGGGGIGGRGTAVAINEIPTNGFQPDLLNLARNTAQPIVRNPTQVAVPQQLQNVMPVQSRGYQGDSFQFAVPEAIKGQQRQQSVKYNGDIFEKLKNNKDQFYIDQYADPEAEALPPPGLQSESTLQKLKEQEKEDTALFIQGVSSDGNKKKSSSKAKTSSKPFSKPDQTKKVNTRLDTKIGGPRNQTKKRRPLPKTPKIVTPINKSLPLVNKSLPVLATVEKNFSPTKYSSPKTAQYEPTDDDIFQKNKSPKSATKRRSLPKIPVRSAESNNEYGPYTRSDEALLKDFENEKADGQARPQNLSERYTKEQLANMLYDSKDDPFHVLPLTRSQYDLKYPKNTPLADGILDISKKRARSDDAPDEVVIKRRAGPTSQLSIEDEKPSTNMVAKRSPLKPLRTRKSMNSNKDSEDGVQGYRNEGPRPTLLSPEKVTYPDNLPPIKNLPDQNPDPFLGLSNEPIDEQAALRSYQNFLKAKEHPKSTPIPELPGLSTLSPANDNSRDGMSLFMQQHPMTPKRLKTPEYQPIIYAKDPEINYDLPTDAYMKEYNARQLRNSERKQFEIERKKRFDQQLESFRRDNPQPIQEQEQEQAEEPELSFESTHLQNMYEKSEISPRLKKSSSE